MDPIWIWCHSLTMRDNGELYTGEALAEARVTLLAWSRWWGWTACVHNPTPPPLSRASIVLAVWIGEERRGVAEEPHGGRGGRIVCCRGNSRVVLWPRAGRRAVGQAGRQKPWSSGWGTEDCAVRDPLFLACSSGCWDRPSAVILRFILLGGLSQWPTCQAHNSEY